MTTLFITGTSTNVGKTWLTQALVQGLTAFQMSPERNKNSTLAPLKVAAIKPFETGITGLHQSDAERIDHTGQLWKLPAWVRLQEPVSPLAAKLKDPSITFDLPAMSRAVSTIQQTHDLVLIEGAGGPLVPIENKLMIADVVREWTKDVLLVAPNQLGTISHTLSAVESLRSRSYEVLAIALIAQCDTDASVPNNGRILTDHAETKVFELPHCSSPNELTDNPATQDLIALVRALRPQALT